MVLEQQAQGTHANLPASLANTLLHLPTNIYVDSSLPKYNYSQAMLTAELLKRNHRLN